ncbi:MAG: hypothetical protein ACOC90_02250 [Bacteroidota bacterium]
MRHHQFPQREDDLYNEVRKYFRTYNKLDTIDYLSDINDPSEGSNIVEVRFKNTRKAFYRNIHGFSLNKGDVIAVEAFLGHDIGIVSLTGFLAEKQFKRKIICCQNTGITSNRDKIAWSEWGTEDFP